MSIARLSRESGVSRSTITDLERGDAGTPALRTILRLAEVLQVEPQFFEVVPGDGPPEGAFHLRSRVRSPPKKILKRLRAKAEQFNRITLALEEHAEFPPDTLPRRRASTLPEIEAVAAECRQFMGIPKDAPIRNVTRLIERAGGLVSNYRDEYVKTEAFCWASWRPLIFANLETGDGRPPQVTRLRSCLAHELGHIVLHGGLASGDARREEEAWYFASCFLLPRRALRAEFPAARRRIPWTDLWAIKQKWGLPGQMVAYAAAQAGLMSDDLHTRFYKRINHEGWKNREPHEPSGFVEEPEITRSVARALEDELGVTSAEIATQVGLTPAQATEVSGIDVAVPENVISFDFMSRQRSS